MPSRRDVLAGLSGAAVAGLAGCGGSSEDVGPTTEAPPTLADASAGGPVGDAPVYDHLADDSVTVFVGVRGNGGYYAYEPAAVAVTPGTELVFRWTGRGGLHNVVAPERDVQSELTGEEGHTFRYTVEETGRMEYFCGPHRSNGMYGVVLVRDP